MTAESHYDAARRILNEVADRGKIDTREADTLLNAAHLHATLALRDAVLELVRTAQKQNGGF